MYLIYSSDNPKLVGRHELFSSACSRKSQTHHYDNFATSCASNILAILPIGYLEVHFLLARHYVFSSLKLLASFEQPFPLFGRGTHLRTCYRSTLGIFKLFLFFMVPPANASRIIRVVGFTPLVKSCVVSIS